MRMSRSALIVVATAVALSAAGAPAKAETVRQFLIEKLKERTQAAPDIDPAEYLPGSIVVRVQYGASREQTLDVYRPPNARRAPIIVMVHGGAWAIGDKNSPSVVVNKLKHWLPKGFLVVSVDYRMLPEARPDVQAADVAAAIAYLQRNAATWGGDANRLVLMGHSAGAHLVSLLSADPARVVVAGGRPWSGTVVLDSAGLDVTGLMTRPHARIYDDAFGADDPAYWASVSPIANLTPQSLPMMLVCSTLRPDDSCGTARAFATAAGRATGITPPVLPESLTHNRVDADLGLPGPYTTAVDAFIDGRVGT